jgi:hypothetical protein
MASGDSVRTIRAPGRVVVDPTTSFHTTAYPYGGTEIGKVKMVVARAEGTPYRVFSEGLGEFQDVLEPAKLWTITMFLRGADNDAVEQLLAGGYAEGTNTKHAVFSEPGDRIPGQSMLSPGGALTSRAVALAYVPDDTIHVNGMVAYRALPNFQATAELKFQRGEEFGLPLVFDCLYPDATWPRTPSESLQIGRMNDLTTPS